MILTLINVLLLVLGCLVDMAPSILITTPILSPVVMKFGVDPASLRHDHADESWDRALPSAGRRDPIRRLCGRPYRMEDVMREIWPFYGVMFLVLMLVTYIPAISLWLPRALSL